MTATDEKTEQINSGSLADLDWADLEHDPKRLDHYRKVLDRPGELEELLAQDGYANTARVAEHLRGTEETYFESFSQEREEEKGESKEEDENHNQHPTHPDDTPAQQIIAMQIQAEQQRQLQQKLATLALLPPDQQEKYLELIMKGLTPDEL
ncbi:MAG: hypothetical protein ACREGI_01150, partial [Candidatus Levyibacteriota bacterium]